MPNNFVNEVQKDSVVNDIHDKRLVELTNADVGKFLKVKDDLTIEVVDAPSGGGLSMVSMNVDIASALSQAITVSITQGQYEEMASNSTLGLHLIDTNIGVSFFAYKFELRGPDIVVFSGAFKNEIGASSPMYVTAVASNDDGTYSLEIKLDYNEG